MLLKTAQGLCRMCSKFRDPGDLMGAPGRGFVCKHCMEKHWIALGVLSGDVPTGCQGCGYSLADLQNISGGVETRMYVVPKDGIYQVLCKRCCDSYVARRRDVYGATQFGRRLNL
jgi:hypothetical protein